MAQTKIWPIKTNLWMCMKYIMNPAKTDNGKWVTPINMFVAPTDWQNATQQMNDTKARFGKPGGRLAYHMEQSFKPGEVTPELAHRIGLELAKELFGDKYMGDALLQKEYTTDTLPFRKKRNHGEKPQYYVENSNPPIISQGVFQAAQRLQDSRTTTAKREHNSPLSGILRCPDCGNTFRRQLLRGTVYWMCSDKAAGASNCQSRRVRENAVYDTFCLMVDKLSSHRQDLLGTLIHQLELMQSRNVESQERIRQIDKQIADLSAQNLVVARLHTNGILNATDFAAQSSVISNRINALRLDRKRAMAEEDDDELIYTLKSLDDALSEYVQGTFFDQRLFEQIVQSITVADNARLTFHLIGGLALTEQIPENVRCRTA